MEYLKIAKGYTKTFLLSMVAGQLLLFSCSTFLEEDPVALATADPYLTTKDGIEDGVRGAYSHLRSFYGTASSMFMTVVGTDIYTNGFGGQINAPAWNNYTDDLNSNQGFLSNLWESFYRGINDCNTIVTRVPVVEDMSETEKNIAIGEARFLRALYYFDLVRQFGDVHFTLEETSGVETEATRIPVETIYAEGIIPDLEFAIANLPDPNEVQNFGRASRPAAEALLARVHLTLGNWGEAEELATNVIEDYGFALVTPIEDLWDIANETNSEVIWSVQYTTDAINNGQGNRLHTLFLWTYSRNPALFIDLENGRHFQRFMPTNYFLDLWDTESDARWDSYFKTEWFANQEAQINGLDVAVGDLAAKFVLNTVDMETKESVPYWFIDYDPNSDVTTTQQEFLRVGSDNRRVFPPLWKFYDPRRISPNDLDGTRDFIVLRLAEMYLIASEAAFRQNRSQDAADWINQLRERAVKPGREAEMNVSATDMDLEFILDERARELCGEMHRWYDLKRTGTLLDRVRLYNADASENISEMHLVRPIPQSQLDLVSNPEDFPQNPGY